MQPSPAPETRFSDRVENYVKYRPSYPQAVFDWLNEQTGLGTGSLVADVGSGTGISTAMFLKQGCEGYAVEPNLEMRQAAERLLADYPKFHSVVGTAETTTLPDQSVEFAAAAQAFHWFDPEKTRAEFQRILKPNGWIVLIWNVRQLDTTPFLRDYENLLITHGTDYTAVRHENIGQEKLGAFFGNGAYRKQAFGNVQQFDFEGLKGRLLSSSYAPAEGKPGHEEMIADLEIIFQKHSFNGQVSIEYTTEIYLGKAVAERG